MRPVAIVGAGMIPFGEKFEMSIKEMVPRAVTAAINSVDKGFDRQMLQAAWIGVNQPFDGIAAGILADSAGLLDIPITRIENACATGNDTIRNAFFAVTGGAVDIALVVGTDKVRDTSAQSTFWDWMGISREYPWDYPLGLIAPANFALHAARYMHDYGVSREHLAGVAVKNHHNAVTNPMAHLRYEVTVDDVLSAPLVVEPFGLLDCTPQSDGAAALILVAGDLAGRFTEKPAWIRGVGLGLDRVMHAHKPDLSTFPATVKAARSAYAMAGITPGDIDVAEVHDCFTAVELISYEDLGFCARGEAKRLIESGETSLAGKRPVNPSGGLKAKGHPPGATGVAQNVELWEQLRGEAANQVDQPHWALAHNIGGPTAVGAVTILEGPA
jgi:acetyl-CoA C-acetyltransferase